MVIESQLKNLTISLLLAGCYIAVETQEERKTLNQKESESRLSVVFLVFLVLFLINTFEA